METMSDLVSSALEILTAGKDCCTCWHNRRGHCSLYSCGCATAIARGSADPPRWTSYDDGEIREAIIMGRRMQE